MAKKQEDVFQNLYTIRGNAEGVWSPQFLVGTRLPYKISDLGPEILSWRYDTIRYDRRV